MSCGYETRVGDALWLNRCLLDFTSRNIRGDVLEI